jgi:tRNA/tmRNA/rRNA uracil-C5-methylase (TrmA/RlmC/RlmD family)
MGLEVGDEFEVEIGPIAHGGHCIAHAEGRTLLVRHCLPGERVRVRVTHVASKVSRADAVEVLRPSPMRVKPPCPVARPGGCGGCDFQHASVPYQRELKAQVIADAFRRHARMDGIHVRVEALQVAGEIDEGRHWRTRMRWQVGAGGELGLHAHRSNAVVPVAQCLIAAEQIAEPPRVRLPAGAASVRCAVGSDGKSSVLVDEALVSGSRRSRQEVGGRTWRVDVDSFWQAHPSAPAALVGAVMQMAAPMPGEHWWDLYAGTGLFSAFIADAVGTGGIVDAVEGSEAAVRDARRSLHDLPQVRLHQADVGSWLAGFRDASAGGQPDGQVHGIVLDPPRSGLGSVRMGLLAAVGPRLIAYVSCDPVSLARDVAAAEQAGYRLAGMRAFDAFPMTHHVEIVAALVPDHRRHEIS